MQTSSATCRTPSSFPEVQLHTISSASDWPLAVRSVTSLLSKPLPRWVCRGPYPPTAPFAAYLIPELEAQTLATATACSTDDNHTSLRLKETYNLIMSSCADLRTLASRSPMEPVLTKTITFGLVASLFRSFSRELSPRKYLKFVDGETAEFLLVLTVTNDDLAVSEEKLLPFVRSEPNREQGAVEIDASRDAIVIDGDNDGGIVDKNAVDTGNEDDGVPNADLDAMDEDDDDAMDEDEDEGIADDLDTSEDEGIADDLDTSEDDTSEILDSSEDVSHEADRYPVRRGSSWYDQGFFSESDGRTVRSRLSRQPSQASLEVLEHAHILESSRPRAWVDVPVVCVAEATDMPLVMSKVLYQRQIWGVKEPVVGIITSDGGSTVRVAIGWLEETGTETVVQLATASGHSSDSQLGGFHLIDPLECMSFAWFILGLERHVKSMSASLLTAAKGFVYPSWGWTPDKSRVSLGRNAYIEQWRLQVAKAEHIPTDFLCESSCPRPEDPTIMAPKSSKGKAKPTVDRPGPAPDRVQQIGSTRSDTADTESAGTSGLSTAHTEATHTTRVSNSKRCERGELSTEKGGTVLESLIDRQIYIIPNAELRMKEINPQDATLAAAMPFVPFIQQIVNIYKTDTDPCVATWIKEREIIPTDTLFAEYFEALCDDADLNALQNTLEPIAGLSIKDRLASLAQCCDLAITRNGLHDMRSTNEMERRQAWDMLAVISFLTTRSRAKSSIDVVLERGLNFPLHPAARELDKYGSSKDYLQYYSRRLSMLRQLSDLLETYSTPLAGENGVAQCEAGSDVIDVLFLRVRNLLKMTNAAASFQEIMRQRCAREPLIGICDTTLVVPCPGVGRSIHATLYKTLRKRDSHSEPKAVFELSVEMMEDFLVILSPAPSHTSEPQHIPRRPDSEKIRVPNDDDAGDHLQPVQPLKLGAWPDISICNNPAFKSRIFKALNPLAADCGTTDGLPKRRHQTKPDISPPTTSPNNDTIDTLEREFLNFLSKYTAAGKDHLEKRSRGMYKNTKLTMGERVLKLDVDLLLPLLTVEYKKADESTIHKATNQSLTYAAAVLLFFQVLGIYNHPTYSMVTNGNLGALFVSMFCQEDPSTSSTPDLKTQALVMEWNVRTYDVANMTDVYHLSVFMQKLAERGEQLKSRFIDHLLPVFLAKVEANPDILKWSMISQLSKAEKTKQKQKIDEDIAMRQKTS